MFLFLIYFIFRKFNLDLIRENNLKLFSLKRYYRYLKIVLTKKTIITFVISSICSNTFLFYQNYKYNSFYNEYDGKTLNIIGTIVDNGEEKEYKNIYKLKIVSINGKTNYRNINLYIENKNKLEYGNKVSFKGEYTAPAKQRNYGGFDYREYLKTKQIYGKVEVKTGLKCIKQNNVNFVFENINNLSKKIQSNIQNILSKETQALFLGILIGYTDEISDETRAQFSDSNLSHILAISGAHVSYITIFFIYIFKNLNINKRCSQIIISLFLIFFMFLTNFSVSVVRACVSGIISIMAGVLYRKKDTTVTLCIPILIILIYNPFLIKSMSLILTYAGTISIVLFNENILQILNKSNLNKKIEKFKSLKKITSKLNEIISLTISAQIFIFPIIMYSYNTFSTVFLLTSILSSFVVGPIIMGGLILIFFSFINMTFAKSISIYIELPLKFLIYICKIFSDFEFSKIYVKTPNIFYTIIYFLVVLIINYIYSVLKIKEKNATQKRIINIYYFIKYKIKFNKNKIICIILSGFLLITVIKFIPGDLKIYFIDVGQRRFLLSNNSNK